MLNHYALWKYIVITLVFIVGVIYALPNIYKKDPAIYVAQCISEKNNQVFTDTVLCQIKEILLNRKIICKSAVLQTDKVLIRFFYEKDQLYAYQELSTIFSQKYQIFLCFVPDIPYWLSMIKAKPVKLGLDLCGGIYFLIRIDMETVLDKFLDQCVDIIKTVLCEKKILYAKIYKTSNCEIKIDFSNFDYRDQAISVLSKMDYDLVLDRIESDILRIVLSEKEKYAICDRITRQNFTILRYRIYQQLGINEPLVQRNGNNRIIIELPGMQDIIQVKKVLSATASLEFRLVNAELSEFEINNNLVPEDSELKLDANGYLVPLYKQIILSGDSITNSNVTFDEYHRPQVNVFLNKTGSTIISNFTKNNIGKIMATLFIEYKNSDKTDSKGRSILIKHEKVINIATIKSQLGNSFCIVGINDINVAHELSLLLRMGTLAAPIHIEEERIIGPTLGKQNIVQGLTACILGMFISICFMILRYRCFGLIASVALVVNLILIISIMSILPGLVLTMPGIAGIILTLSVAIDANVLINERIKEEIKRNRPIQYAIYMGYKKVLTSIVDANVTTIIIAVILYLVGIESIKGFAMTTIIGVVTSMFTSIVGTRAIVNLVYGRKRISKLSI